MSVSPQLLPLPAFKKPGRPIPGRPVPVPAKQQDALVVCQDNVAFMRSLAADSMKLIVTSPPYNLGKEYETKSSLDIYLEAQRASIKEAVRVLHPNGSICWQIGNYVDEGEVYPLDILLYSIFKQAGLFLRNRIIWLWPRPALPEEILRAIRDDSLVHQGGRLHLQP